MIKRKVLLGLVFLCSANLIFATSFDEEQEAESATLSGNYTIATNGNASGGSFVKLLSTSPNGTLLANLSNIPYDGTYKLEVFSFNGGTTIDLDMSINGGVATSITLDPSNWAFEGPANATLLDVNLVTGSNTITFTANGSTVSMDKIVVREDYDIYYVSAAGNDTNDGSINTPWLTLAKATEAAKSQSNSGILQPGDKLLFNRGDTFEGQFAIDCSGTESQPIEIGSYGTGELPILSGSGNIPTGDYIEAVKMTNTSYITIDGLWIKNNRQYIGDITWGTNTSYGIKVIANKWGGVSKGLTFRNLKITDVFAINMLDWQGNLNTDNHNAHAMFLDSDMDDDTVNPIVEVGIDDVLIENCYFYNLGTTGISIRHLSTGTYNNPIDEEERNMNYVIRNNIFQELGGDGIVFASVCNGLVEHNEFIDLGMGDHDTPSDRFYGRGEGCWIWDSRNIIVQFNKQYSARGFGDCYGSAGHIDFYCKNAIYQYNYSEDTEGGFVEILGDCENSTFRYNVSVNDGFRDYHGYTIWISGYIGSGKSPVRSNNNYIYNNTIYLNQSDRKPDIDIWAKNTYIYNNIFKAINGAKIGSDGVTIDIESGSQLYVDSNLFYGDIATAFTNLDSNKITGQDPQFVNEGSGDMDGYKLQSTSPVIDAGKAFPEPVFPMAGQGIFANISLNTATDIYGNPVDITNLLPNIGADNNFNNLIDKDAIRVTGVSVSNQNGTIEVSNTQQFTATVLPNDATNKNVTWSSDDVLVATVDTNGLVTGVSEGAATLTVTTDDGSFTDTTTITIGDEFVINLINGDFEDGLNNWDTWNSPTTTNDVNGGNLAAQFYDKGSINQWVTVEANTDYILSGYLKTSDTAERVVFGVNDTNNVGIKSIDVYDANYTRHEISFNSGSSTSIKVYVWQPPSGVTYAYADDIQLIKDVPTAVTGITLSAQSGSLEVGGTYQMNATISPANATNQSITWSSDDSAVATVSNGVVSAVGIGTASITATTADGGFADNTTITVSPSSIAAFKNGDFEDGLNYWSTWKTVTTSATGAYEGNAAVQLTGSSSVGQLVLVEANTSYTLSGYVKVDDPSNERVVFGVEDVNGVAFSYIDVTNQSYTYHEMTFNTGSNTSVNVYLWRPSNGVNNAYMDNVKLVKNSTTSSKSASIKIDTMEITEEPSSRMYPNPANDKVFISTHGLQGKVHLTLYNNMGVQVKHRMLSAKKSTNHKLSVKNLARGYYYLTLTDEAGERRTSTLLLK